MDIFKINFEGKNQAILNVSDNGRLSIVLEENKDGVQSATLILLSGEETVGLSDSIKRAYRDMAEEDIIKKLP
jgi:hypothetical protein